MTKLKTLHGQITKEQRRIEMLKNTKSNGDSEWYDFVREEIQNAKTKIAELQKEFDLEYARQN